MWSRTPIAMRRLVERRADVDVLVEVVPGDRLEDQAGQLVDRRDVVHQEDPAGLADPLDVLAELQDVELAVLGVPVAADALERRGPVHERVGHDADLRVAERDEAALEVGDHAAEVALAGRRMRIGGGRLIGRRLGGGRLLGQHADAPARDRRQGRDGSCRRSRRECRRSSEDNT